MLSSTHEFINTKKPAEKTTKLIILHKMTKARRYKSSYDNFVI